MTRGRRLRSLVIGVAVATLLLVAGSRWAGRRAGGAGAAGRRAADGTGAAVRAGAAGDDPLDLSFYGALGTTPAQPGEGAPAPAESLRRRPEEANRGEAAFVVLALATRDRAEARRLRDRLAARGLPATIAEGKAGGAPVYRVRVGRYRDRAVALVLARRLRENEGLNPWVLPESD